MGIQTLKRLLLGLLLITSTGFLPVQAHEYNFAPVSGHVTSPFGWRTDPMNGSNRFHGGIDIAAAAGMPVYAPQAATVMYSGYHGGYGNVVVLDHGNSLFTLYGHNSKLLVSAGQQIARGQQIALVGSTGRSTGPHLHFEVHYNKQYVNPVTYLSYLQQQGGQLLAQANPGVSNQNARTVQTAQAEVRQAAPKRTVKRQTSRRTYGKNVVQVVNGTKIENVQF